MGKVMASITTSVEAMSPVPTTGRGTASAGVGSACTTG